MGVPFAGVCAALSAVMAATIVVAAEAPEGPYRESIMLLLCVAFHGGMALLIHGVQRGVPPQQGYPGKVAAAETGAVYDNSGMFTHESGMTAGEAVPLAEQVRKLKDQLKGSVYNSSGMASAVDYGAVYGDSGMFPAAKKGSVYDNSGMPPPADKGSYYNMFAHEPDGPDVTAGEVLPFTEQVFAAKEVAAVGQDKVAGAFTERVRRFLPVVGQCTMLSK